MSLRWSSIYVLTTVATKVYVHQVSKSERQTDACFEWTIFKSSLWILAHLSWKFKWDILNTFCLSSVCLSVCKLFAFSTFFREPLGQYQSNLAQSTFRQKREEKESCLNQGFHLCSRRYNKELFKVVKNNGGWNLT